jgi:hypothetical protein
MLQAATKSRGRSETTSSTAEREPRREVHLHSGGVEGLRAAGTSGFGASARAARLGGRVDVLQRTIGNQAVLRMLASADQKQPSVSSNVGSVLQRKCACGGGPDCDCDSTDKREHKAHGLHRMSASQTPLRMTDYSTPGIRTKLAINQPGDSFEQEADRVADQVMRMDAGAMLQRSWSAGAADDKIRRKSEQCDEPELRRKATDAAPQFAPPSVHDVLNSPGQPLDQSTRAFMEPRFGRDFGDVQIHTTNRAADSAREVNALAYTAGNHIVFGAGRYSPSSADGQRLLAHELTHVAQQGSAKPVAVQRDLATAPPAVPPRAQADLTPAQITDAINFNRARYNEANTRLIQNLLGGPVTGTWTEENIVAIASTQAEYGLHKDGKVGNETLRFLDREQRLEGASTKTEDCLVSFAIIGPDRANFGRDDPTHCHFGSHFRMEAQFSPRCNCDQFQYRQFISGHWHRTRAGVQTDIPINEVGGVLLDGFNEDADVTDPVPNYGHREQPAGGNVEDHYINAGGADDQAHGCRYRGEDFPGFVGANLLGDCLPGDRYDLLTRFRGEIQRNGRPIQSKFWTALNLVNWRP